MFNRLFNLLTNKPTFDRSPKWPSIRTRHLTVQPICQCCGTVKGLNVHHIRPVHLYPHLELALDNLITLCETNQCHFLIGHGRDWKAYNPNVISDSIFIRQLIQTRLYA